jgi:hypothetical protein
MNPRDHIVRIGRSGRVFAPTAREAAEVSEPQVERYVGGGNKRPVTRTWFPHWVVDLG